MTVSNTLSYDRAPSKELRRTLKEGFLTPILHLSKRSVSGCNLDVHLRANDEVHVYCGHAVLVTARLNKNGTIKLDANKSFRDQTPGAKLFRTWGREESGFEETLNLYFENVTVDDSKKKEGLVQARWACVNGSPWTPFDRECVLAGRDRETSVPEVNRALRLLRDISVRSNRGAKPWAEPDEPTGSELDQIAVDGNGSLVLIELKDANSTGLSSIFYAPLQLLRYVYEWHEALVRPSVQDELHELINARRELGLTPDGPSLTGRIRAAVCFGDDARTDEVKRRFYEALGVVNAHLPSDVGPIETWMLDTKSKPTPL